MECMAEEATLIDLPDDDWMEPRYWNSMPSTVLPDIVMSDSLFAGD